MNLKFFHKFFQKNRKLFGVISAVITIVLLFAPLLLFVDPEKAKSMGYVGFFVANYVGIGTFVLPFLLQTLNPYLLIIIGGFGVSIDEFFAWYAGSVSTELKHEKKWHVKIQNFIKRYGLYGIFIFGLMPFPGIIYAVSGFAAGHFGISFWRFYITNFSAKTIRTAVFVVLILKFIL